MIAAYERTDSDRIAGVLDMVWRKAPLFLRSGDLVENEPERLNPCQPLAPEKRAEILRRFARQRATGRVCLMTIAREAGVSYNCVAVHTRALRRAAS